MTDTPELPVLTALEARILGSLVEKEATTPDAYPLTANAVQLACNQKNGRDPVSDYDAGDVGHALRSMEARRLLRSVHGARAQRYEHRFAETWSLTRQQQALLSLLLLRGAQTVAELLARSERLAPVADADEARQILERLIARGLVVNIGRAAGQREDRFMHLLSGPVDPAAIRAATSRDAPERAEAEGRGGSRAEAVDARLDAAEARVEAAEARVEAAEARIDALQRELAALQARWEGREASF